MKKLLLLLLVLSVFASYAQVPSYVPTNGLVGYWPFNGNANDVSGNGNNGVVNGATLTTDRFGSANASYNFNGSSSYIRINNSTSLNSSSVTISGWFNTNDLSPNDSTGAKGIIGKWWQSPSACNSNYNAYLICLTKPTGTSSTFLGGATSFYEGNVFYANTAVNTNTWYHFAFVHDATSGGKLYINGVLINSNTSLGNICNSINAINIGADVRNGSLWRFFNGKIDDIAIHNRALSQSEITGLYNSGTNPCIPSYVPTNGLVGYWPFCGNANDESGNGNNGTVNGATLTSDRFGNVGKAYDFSGSSDYATLPSATTSTVIKTMSVCLWAKHNNANATGFIFDKAAAPGYYDKATLLQWGLELRLYNENSFYNTFQNVQDTNWHQYVAIWKDTAVTLYIDGIFKGTGILGNSFSNTPGIITLGKMNGYSPDNYSGKIDDIGIYNRALSSTEIQNLYTASVPTSCIANITTNDTTICSGSTITLNVEPVTPATVTDINGNVYPSVNIGAQTWMQKNLNVSKYKNGDIIPQVRDSATWANTTTGAWCWVGNDSATFDATYGRLYNWYAVNDPRGLAPNGWHIPSNTEEHLFVKSLDPNADTTCGMCGQSSIAGNLLKEAGTLHWSPPNNGATNSTGFTMLPGGNRGQYSQFGGPGYGGAFWLSSSIIGNSLGYYCDMYSPSTYLGRGYISKNCGFSVRALRNTPTYLWSTGATTPSITVSPLVTTTYYCTVSDGINTCKDSVKVSVNTAIPSTVGVITGLTDVCAAIGTATVSAPVTYSVVTMSTASSYTWTVPAGVTIVSGQGTTALTVTFNSSFVSGAISVIANNACGSSLVARSLTVYKRISGTPGTIAKEFAPSIVAVTSVCGLASETYKIRKVTYATSYNWSLNVGSYASITHMNASGINDTAIVITFVSGFTKDTVSVRSVTACSISAVKTIVLNATLTPPNVTAITNGNGNFAVCVGSIIRYTAISTAPTATQSNIAYYRWTRPANTTIVSATSDSASISLSYNAGFTAGTLSVRGQSACSVTGTGVTATIQFYAPTPLSIVPSTGSYNACIGNVITYSILVPAPSTAQTIASVFRWTIPANSIITTASSDSSTITVRYNTGFTGGNITVRSQTACGLQGTIKSQAITHAGCATGTKQNLPVTNTEELMNKSFDVSLYPNPTANEFKLLVTNKNSVSETQNKNLPVIVKVIDAQGRLIKSVQVNINQVTSLGNDLNPGAYMLNVMQGNTTKTIRAVKF